jgi:predicted nucleic acid-binding protein
MIILDANVVSEPLKSRGMPAMAAWLDSQDAVTLYLTAPSLVELLVGVEILPQGRRRQKLGEQLVTLLARLFGNRILLFDQSAATAYAKLVRQTRAAGLALPLVDGQIATIAIARGFSVATRDTGPFVAAGLTVINPWAQAAAS